MISTDLVQFESVSRKYGQQCALRDLSLTIEQGEILGIVGPSGAGKSTLLRLLAELEKPDSGSLRFYWERGLSAPCILVFQDFQLFSHMSVFENVAFGLRARRVQKSELKSEVNSMLELLGIQELAKKYPAQISGGEKQRVALARALVLKPALLLLDEPFASLDKNLTKNTAELVRALNTKFATSLVLVTHDFEAAFSISDRLGVLLQGRLCALGRPSEVIAGSKNLEAAEFLGPLNLITGEDRKNHALLHMPEKQLYLRPDALCFIADEGGSACVILVENLSTHIILHVEHNSKLWKISSLDRRLVVGSRGIIRENPGYVFD